jgi:GAF domain-containing protein
VTRVHDDVPQELWRAFERLSGVLLSKESLDAVLNLITDTATQAIPGADDVSVSLLRDGRVETAAHARQIAKEADELQYQLAEGPCLDSAQTGKTNKIASMATETRWPSYVRGAIEKGVGSSLSIPLRVRDDPLGALNIYSEREDAFAEDSVHLAERFGQQAAILLANAEAFVDKDVLSEQLKTALESREMIGKAIGILMAREGISDADAFNMLRTASQNSNIKLRDIASEILQQTRPDSTGDDST